MELAGKVALVTGAGSGIGRATAVLLARQGVRVGALSHTAEEIDRLVAEVAQQGGDALTLTADVAEDQELARAVSMLVDRYGRLDLVVANAGINGVWAPIDELTTEDWDRTITTNLRGTFLTLRNAVPHLRRSGAGSIVLVASINGTRTFSNSGATAYACTKAGVAALGQMLAVELAPQRIRVNTVCPGKIDTEIEDNTEQRDIESVRWPVEFPKGQIPLTEGRPGTAMDVAELICFLLSDRARHITGTPVCIDGGQSLIV